MPHKGAGGRAGLTAGMAALICFLAAIMLNAGSGGAARGKALFERRCSGCHAMDRDKEGPRLRGVYGRASATAAAFEYSDALRNAHLVWDDKSLDQWLADPEKVAPGNEMGFQVADPSERAEIIAYIKLASGR